MALTKEMREVLVLARKEIEEERYYTICFSLDAIGKKFKKLAPAARELKIFIQRALGRNAYLEGWQRVHGFGWRTQKQCVKDRVAWIDWILEGE